MIPRDRSRSDNPHPGDARAGDTHPGDERPGGDHGRGENSDATPSEGKEGEVRRNPGDEPTHENIPDANVLDPLKEGVHGDPAGRGIPDANVVNRGQAEGGVFDAGDLRDRGERFQEEDVPAESEDDGPDVTMQVLRAAPTAARIRLDRFIMRSVANVSRTRVQDLIEAGGVEVNGTVVRKSGRIVQPGDIVVCTIPKPPPPDIVAEDIPLDIVHEDDDVIVVNKPAGMVSHPAYGNYTGTLVNALLYHTDALSEARGAERAGILHRLDKGTSGLLCVAKTDRAMTFLARQFAEHTVDREYHAIIWGAFRERRGTISAPVGRHRSDRKKMAVVEGGREAVTDYETLEDFGPLSLIRLKLHTGRTHQIRVHMAHMKHPVLGDPTYGGRRILYGAVTGSWKHFIEQLLAVLSRQALHARTLGFEHPATHARVFFESSYPADFAEVLDMLHRYFSDALPEDPRPTHER